MVGNRWIWLVEPAPTKYGFVGAPLTNHNCPKQTISKTRPRPTVNMNVHLDCWWGWGGFMEFWVFHLYGW